MIVQEESASEGASQKILIVIVAVLGLIVVILATFCFIKRKRSTRHDVIIVPKETAGPENISFDDAAKP